MFLEIGADGQYQLIVYLCEEIFIRSDIFAIPFFSILGILFKNVMKGTFFCPLFFLLNQLNPATKKNVPRFIFNAPPLIFRIPENDQVCRGVTWLCQRFSAP